MFIKKHLTSVVGAALAGLAMLRAIVGFLGDAYFDEFFSYTDGNAFALYRTSYGLWTDLNAGKVGLREI